MALVLMKTISFVLGTMFCGAILASFGKPGFVSPTSWMTVAAAGFILLLLLVFISCRVPGQVIPDSYLNFASYLMVATVILGLVEFLVCLMLPYHWVVLVVLLALAVIAVVVIWSLVALGGDDDESPAESADYDGKPEP